MKFTKMQGLGNDYIYINAFEERVEDPPALARRLSDRHFGIGGDGLVLIAPSDKADFRMVMYNADGSRGAMCGNASRCVGKYVYDRGMTDKTVVTLETDSGVKTLNLTVENGKTGGHRASASIWARRFLIARLCRACWGRASSSGRRSRPWGVGLKSHRFRWATRTG